MDQRADGCSLLFWVTTMPKSVPWESVEYYLILSYLISHNNQDGEQAAEAQTKVILLLS